MNEMMSSLETRYLLWACPECHKLMGLERKAPENLRYCTVSRDKVICKQKMPTQEVRDNFLKYGVWSMTKKKDEEK